MIPDAPHGHGTEGVREPTSATREAIIAARRAQDAVLYSVDAGDLQGWVKDNHGVDLMGTELVDAVTEVQYEFTARPLGQRVDEAVWRVYAAAWARLHPPPKKREREGAEP